MATKPAPGGSTISVRVKRCVAGVLVGVGDGVGVSVASSSPRASGAVGVGLVVPRDGAPGQSVQAPARRRVTTAAASRREGLIGLVDDPTALAPIHRDRLASDASRFVGDEKEHQVGYIFGV